jgi:hypothetical protein
MYAIKVVHTYKKSLLSVLALALCAISQLFSYDDIEKRLNYLEKKEEGIYGKNASDTTGAVPPKEGISYENCEWYINAEFMISQIFRYNDVEERLNCLEKEMEDIYGKNASGTTGAIFARGRNPHDDCEWYVDAEVLFWHIKSGATDWAIAFNEMLFPRKGRMHTLGFQWDWGVRVGIGEYFKEQGWDLNLFYTYYQTHDKANIRVPLFQMDLGADIETLDLDMPTPILLISAAADFYAKVTYNNIDLNLGRSFFTSKDMMIHPHIGLKNIWLKEGYELDENTFMDATQTPIPVAGSVITLLENTNKLLGIGPSVGLDISWSFCKSIQFIAAGELALLQGYFKVHQKEGIFILPIGATSSTGYIHLGGNEHRFISFGRGLLGLNWGEYFNQKKQHIDLSVAYEVNYIWRENQMIQEIDIDPPDAGPDVSPVKSVRLLIQRFSEDIAFYGFSLKVKIDF